jgi:hypothetical protein
MPRQVLDTLAFPCFNGGRETNLTGGELEIT